MSERPVPTNRSYWTISEVAEHFRVAEKTVRRWIAHGDLVAVKMRGSMRVADTELRLYIQRSTVGRERPTIVR